MCFATMVAERSTCERNQVGAVVTSFDCRRIYGYGYNGNYAGGPDECDDPKAIGQCGCVHAEANALVSAERTDGAVLVTTCAPCVPCAKLIINARIVRVIYLAPYRNVVGIETLRRAGIEVLQLIQGGDPELRLPSTL